MGTFSGSPFWGKKKKKMMAEGPGGGRTLQQDTNHKTSNFPRTQPVALIIPSCHSCLRARLVPTLRAPYTTLLQAVHSQNLFLNTCCMPDTFEHHNHLTKQAQVIPFSG